MATMVGPGPEQVPTNGMLGTMAYQDADNARLTGVVNTNQALLVPVTGFSATLDINAPALILDPAGALATGTILLPAGPPDKTTVSVCSSATITALTLTPAAGQAVKNAPTTLAAGTSFSYRYSLANTTWYRQS